MPRAAAFVTLYGDKRIDSSPVSRYCSKRGDEMTATRSIAKRFGIPRTYQTHQGDHGNRIHERIERGGAIVLAAAGFRSDQVTIIRMAVAGGFERDVDR